MTNLVLRLISDDEECQKYRLLGYGKVLEDVIVEPLASSCIVQVKSWTACPGILGYATYKESIMHLFSFQQKPLQQRTYLAQMCDLLMGEH